MEAVFTVRRSLDQIDRAVVVDVASPELDPEVDPSFLGALDRLRVTGPDALGTAEQDLHCARADLIGACTRSAHDEIAPLITVEVGRQQLLPDRPGVRTSVGRMRSTPHRADHAWFRG